MKSARWTTNPSKNYNQKSYTIEDLISSIDFLLDNTFVQFGPFMFHQIKGIPMGGNCSPLLADLYLTWLEFEYMENLNKNKNEEEQVLVKKLSQNSRYIDDIACPNVENFLEIAKDIYPDDIPLEGNNSELKRDVFLDLDIRASDKVLS